MKQQQAEDNEASSHSSDMLSVEDLALDEQQRVDVPSLERAVSSVILALGEDPSREGLLDTPRVMPLTPPVCPETAMNQLFTRECVSLCSGWQRHGWTPALATRRTSVGGFSLFNLVAPFCNTVPD